MANETQIGQLVIDLKIKTEALEKGLETAKKKLQEIEGKNKSLESSNKSLDSSWLALAATATIVFAGIVSSIKSATEEYKAHTQAMSSLQNVADYTGESMSDLSSIMDKYEGIMTKSDLATTIKNFTLMGMSAKDTEKMIEALTNSAIRNRNANYTVSEAVRVASEGYRQGLSTLSDSAGVTENLSAMQDKYAKSIGKTTSQLTEAEINQAYLNRTMAAAEPFAGAMNDYLDSLAGKQGQYSQAMKDTQVAYVESMEPILSKFEEFKTTMISGLGDIISSHEGATAGVTTFVITLGTLIVAITAIKKAYDIYQKSAIAATISTQGFTAALAANPFGTAVIAISAAISVIAGLTTAAEKQAEAQEKLNEITKTYEQIQNGAYEYTSKNIASMEQRKNDIEEQIRLYQEYGAAKQKYEEASTGVWAADAVGKIETLEDGTVQLSKSADELKKEMKEAKKAFEDAQNSTGSYGDSLDKLNDKLKETTKYLDEANAIEKISKGLDTDAIKKKQEEAAQLKINAQTMQEYLSIVKQGNTSTSEYQEAVKQLAQAYPEAANAEGIIIDQAQKLIDAEQLKADTAWNASQTTIQSYIDIINAALQSESTQRQIAQNIGISYEQLTPRLQSVLSLLQTMAGYQATDVPNVKPVSISAPKIKKSSSSKVYSNTKLDNYKKEIEYKKAMDQISLQQEIQMYQKALKSYAKTTDEKRELREKIYELNKELAQKEKELLDQQTEDYENYIQEQKNLRGASYDVEDQTKDYDKIISMHQKYLNQIMKDERLSLDERKEIYREELATIRDYEQQKRDLRVEAVDNTVSQLTDAITKQLEEMQKKDKEMIDKNLEAVEKWKDTRIKAINEEYDARIEAIEKELDALDKSEEEKTRAEEDTEYERKKTRLEELIAFEHDATTKANYQKELDKLVADYQNTLDKRALEDRKEALNKQKDLLQEEQDSKVQAVEDEAEKQKEAYEKQLEELEEYYDKQIDMAQETAEKMLLNVQKNQDQILDLLKKYGDKYELTGQTLGEKLAQGINNGIVGKIQDIIQKIQDTIDANLEAKIKEWTSSNYKYEANADKPKTSTINVTQNNYIENTPEMPSETYRKFNNTTQKLAEELAGI